VTVDVEHDASELTRSDAAAARLGHARQLELAAPDAMTLGAECAWHLHEPIADPSAVVQLAVLLAARRHVDSAFAAHGASILWGSCAAHRIERHRGRMPELRAVKRAYSVWDDHHRRGIYTREFSWQVRDANPFSRHLALHAAHPSNDPLERALYVDLRTSLADGALACAERAAAAAGLSLRYPFLDYELVILAATTPAAIKQRGSTGMHALRRLLLRQIPRTLMPPVRPQAPRHAWLRTALGAMVPTLLFAPRFDGRGIVSRPALRRIWSDHQAGRHDYAFQLWSLVMLEFWFRRCIDSEAAGEPLEYAVLKAVA
jgi:asparagine synthetase B (glutamine-hydrolysing)